MHGSEDSTSASDEIRQQRLNQWDETPFSLHWEARGLWAVGSILG